MKDLKCEAGMLFIVAYCFEGESIVTHICNDPRNEGFLFMSVMGSLVHTGNNRFRTQRQLLPSFKAAMTVSIHGDNNCSYAQR